MRPARYAPKGQTMKTTSKNFENWMRAADEACAKKTGLSIHDLPDCPYHDWYEDGYTPAQAASKAIRYARDEGDF
jgi:hypothetical protein